MREDLVFAVRQLARRPGFAMVAAATLALGIGGSVAIFSVTRAVVLRPLPYADPDRIVLAWQRDAARDVPFLELSYPAFRHWREANAVFEELAGLPSTNQTWTLSGSGEPAMLVGRLVTFSFFDVLGVEPLLGRTLRADDDRRGAARVIVLGHGLWRDRFGADPGLVGRTIALDQEPFTVVGVMPAGFAYPKGAQLWTPLVPGVNELAEQPGVWWMSAIGRLRPGVSLATAERELSQLTGRYHLETHKAEAIAAVVTPFAEAVLGPTRPVLLALLGGVALVLLLACVNVAALQAISLAERAPELAVRSALGATRGRLARALAAESAVVSLAGGAAGTLAAVALLPALVALSPGDVPRLGDARIDAATLLAALALTAGAALATGLLPVLAFDRRSLRDPLAAFSRAVAPGGSRARGALVAAQVALSLAVLVGAGLLVRSFAALRDVPLGFDAEHVIAVEAGAPQSRYPEAAQHRRYTDELVSRLRALPGVESAAAVTLRPLWGSVGMDWPFTLEGQSAREAERNPLLNFQTVTPGYFGTMRIPILRGRAIDERDREGRPGVVVVSQSFARRAWPGQDAIGRRLKLPLPATPYHDAWLEVIGVAGDARYRELSQARFDLYMSYRQSDHRLHHLVVRTRAGSGPDAAAIARAVREHDPQHPAPALVPLTEAVGQALSVPRFAARVFAGFGAVAVLLAALGLYGLVAHAVGRRTREIGLRVTLGARPRDVVRLVLHEGLGPALAGVAAGLAAAAVGVRLLRTLLFGVQALDMVTFLSSSVLLLAVAALAAALPARRALRVDPAAVLRES